MTKRRSYFVRLLAGVLAGVLTAAGCASHYARGALPDVLIRRGPSAFRMLAQVGYSYRALECGEYTDKSAQAHVLTDSNAYQQLYSEWKLCWTPPSVDFEREVVVAFLLPGAGCEGELTGFALSPEGHLSPRVHWLGDMCNQIKVAHRYIAAIPRSALPPGGVVLDVADQETPSDVASDSASWSSAPAAQARAASTDQGVSGRTAFANVEVPARGEARLARLPGTFASWIVHATYAPPSAVSAWVRTPQRAEAVDRPNIAGIFFPVRWDSRNERFYSGWSYYDARGANIMGPLLPNLELFRSAEHGGALELYAPLEVANGPEVVAPAINQSRTPSFYEITALFPEPASSLSEASRIADGDRVKLDADIVRLGADPTLRLCNADPSIPDRFERCRRAGAVVKDAHVVAFDPKSQRGASPEMYFVARGPVIARRSGDGFIDVRALRMEFEAVRVAVPAPAISVRK